MPSTAAQTATMGPKRTTTRALLVVLAVAIILAVWGPCNEHDNDEHNNNNHNDDDLDDDDDDNNDNEANTMTAVGSDYNGGNGNGRGHRPQSTKIGSKDMVAVATAFC